MYNKSYYLYVAPIKGEENSVERQLESGEKYDLVIMFKRDFRTDEVDIAVSIIRKYVPLILIDENEKMMFMEKTKEEETE